MVNENQIQLAKYLYLRNLKNQLMKNYRLSLSHHFF